MQSYPATYSENAHEDAHLAYTTISTPNDSPPQGTFSYDGHGCVASIHTFGASPSSTFSSALGSPFDDHTLRLAEPSSSARNTPQLPSHHLRLAPSNSFLDMHPSPSTQVTSLPPASQDSREVQPPSLLEASQSQTEEAQRSLEYFQKACIDSAKDCEYWQKEYRQLQQELQDCHENFVQRDAQCQRLQHTIDSMQREQRLAAQAPRYLPPPVAEVPSSSAPKRPAHVRSKTSTSPATFHRNLQSFNAPVDAVPKTLASLQLRNTPSFLPSSFSARSFLSSANRLNQQQSLPFASQYYPISSHLDYPSFRHPLAQEQFRNSFQPPARSSSQTTEQLQHPPFAFSSAYPMPPNSRSRSEGTLGLWNVDEVSESSSHPNSNRPEPLY